LPFLQVLFSKVSYSSLSVDAKAILGYIGLMKNIAYIFLGSVLILNLIALFLMWHDKRKAKQDPENRTPEVLLFLSAIYFGAIGIFIGMFLFRHKVRKWYFMVGIPGIIVQNLVFIWTLFFVLP
jgi:uncharacterized membrane protein YsdA (DUF1294 family)